MSNINAKTVLGILGSGQLSRMTALAAYNFGIQTHIYCDSKDHNSPASLISSQTTRGSLNNLDQILYFAKQCDFITLENEFVDSKILQYIDETFPNKLFPSSESFILIGDKISEKENFKKAGIPIVPFQKINSKNDLIEFAKIHSYPIILKKSKGGYDGFGNLKIKSETDIDSSLKHFDFPKYDLLVEKFIIYEKELALVAAKNSTEVVLYPIVETHQDNHICHFVTSPSDISTNVALEIQCYTNLALNILKTRGLFAFEFFLTKDNKVYLNESAPRPHNSAHYTLDACQTSQFENHVRSILDLPLGSTEQKYPAVVMLNLLGTNNTHNQNNQIANLQPLNEFINKKNQYLHLYGKENSKPGRKMGHLTLCGNDLKELMKQAQRLKEIYTL